jgi:hypothetical protein
MPKASGSKSAKTTSSRARKPATSAAARPRRTPSAGAGAKKKRDDVVTATWESRFWTENSPPGVPTTYD